jgi:carboxymethylenebutenolidase
MAASWEQVSVDGSTMKVYKATPAAGATAGSGSPGMIVIHAQGGVDAFLRVVCDRLAEAGYVAAAPNLFHRLSQEDAKPANLVDQEVERDVRAAIGLLPAGEVGDAPVGIVGFCMGGRVSYLMAAKIQELAAGVVFYGGNIRGSKHGNPAPIEESATIECPLLGFFGKDDKNPSQEDVAAISAELQRLGKAHTFHSYDATGHAFMNFLADQSYRQHAAIQAWPTLLAFLERTLKQRRTPLTGALASPA